MAVAAEQMVLERGPLRIELTLRPFKFTVRRAGRRLMRAGGVWVADGTVHDHFVQFTEGVVTREDLGVVERALRARVVDSDTDVLELELSLYGGRTATLRITLAASERVEFDVEAEGSPL